MIVNQYTKESLGLHMVLPVAFHRELSRLPGGVERFADKCNNPKNLPTNFHLDPIATIQQRCLPLLFALLFQQYHSSQIDKVSKFDDSTIIIHKLCQIPPKCQYQ